MSGPGLAQWLWLAAVAWPLLLAAAWARAGWRDLVGRAVAWAAVPALVASIWPGGGTLLVEEVLFGARIGLDDMGRAFLFVTAAVWTAAGVFARGALAGDPGARRFDLFWVLALAGNLALVLAQDLIGFYAGFALMSFASYGLVVHARDPQALRAGRIYVALVVLGEVLIFAGMLGLVRAGAGLAFPVEPTVPVDRVMLACLFAGFGIKVGVVPLHVSLPLIYSASPTPAAAVLGGAMINAGVIGWLRFLPAGVPDAAAFAGPVMAVGLVSAFFGALVGVVQMNPRAVLAYSSISQMGLITVGVGAALLGPTVAPGVAAAVTLYALHHGLAKGALFLAVGVAAGAMTVATRRWLISASLLPALALAGAPLTSGALAKVALKASLVPLPGPWPDRLGLLLPLAAVGTTLLMARFLVLLWRTPIQARRPRTTTTSWGASIALLPLVALATWTWPGPYDAANALAPEVWWSLAWPVLVGSAAAWLAARLGTRGLPRWLRIPPGDLLAGVEWADNTLRHAAAGSFASPTIRHAVAAWFARLATGAGRSGRLVGVLETHLRAWPNVGLLLVLLTGVLFFALSR
jgi:hydrogenase-4 component B